MRDLSAEAIKRPARPGSAAILAQLSWGSLLASLVCLWAWRDSGLLLFFGGITLGLLFGASRCLPVQNLVFAALLSLVVIVGSHVMVGGALHVWDSSRPHPFSRFTQLDFWVETVGWITFLFLSRGLSLLAFRHNRGAACFGLLVIAGTMASLCYHLWLSTLLTTGSVAPRAGFIAAMVMAVVLPALLINKKPGYQPLDWTPLTAFLCLGVGVLLLTIARQQYGRGALVLASSLLLAGVVIRGPGFRPGAVPSQALSRR